MSAFGPGYQHWSGVSTGIWQRRATITRYGLRLCWRSRLLKGIFAIAWTSVLALIAFYFLVGQMLTPDSSLMTYIAENVGKRAHTILNGISGWILLYPDIAVDGLYRTTFFWAAQLYVSLSFFAVALFVPKLISHDLSSQAILIYNSKALTRRDYLIGKFGIVASLLGMLCVAPLLVTWFVGNLMSPDWSFFIHGFPALMRAMAFGLTAVVSLSLLALAISSLAKRTSSATAFWVLGWIVSGIIAQGISRVIPWGRYLSPGNCLQELANQVFHLGQVLENAKEMLPFFNVLLQSMPRRSVLAATPATSTDSVWIPLLFLAGFCALSLLAITKRTQPE